MRVKYEFAVIDKSLTILRCLMVCYHFDNAGFDVLKSPLIIELKANNKTTSPFIDYYSKSKSKFNGVFPVSNEFDIEKQYFNETG